jgi:hypothetical protein
MKSDCTWSIAEILELTMSQNPLQLRVPTVILMVKFPNVVNGIGLLG